MNDRLDLHEAARLLKIDAEVVQQLFDRGTLTGIREGDVWYTTRDLLEGDIELLTETARIDRLRNAPVELPLHHDDAEDESVVRVDALDEVLARLRAEAS